MQSAGSRGGADASAYWISRSLIVLVAGCAIALAGCTQDGELYSCRFANAGTGATYDFTVQADPRSGDAVVVVFPYQGPSDTNTTAPSTTATTASG